MSPTWFKNEASKNWEYVTTEQKLVGYVDVLYTTIGKQKYLAGFCFHKNNDQQEITEYVDSVQDGKEFVEAQYMAYRMIGPFDATD